MKCYVCFSESADLSLHDFSGIKPLDYKCDTLAEMVHLTNAYDAAKKSVIGLLTAWHNENCQPTTPRKKRGRARSPSPQPPLKRSKSIKPFDRVLKQIIDDLKEKTGGDVEIQSFTIEQEGSETETDTEGEGEHVESCCGGISGADKWRRAIMHALQLTDTQYGTMEKIWATREETAAINAMVGMKKIKDQYISLLKFLTNLDKSADRSFLMHMVISGPPGHGKTAIAQLLGKAFQRSGLLKTNKFIMARRADLIGEYCGHTAVQTTKMFNKARGGVIFIDEVYSLGNTEKSDAFTKECIDTINQLLSERTDTLCIVAGYDKEIHDCFFAYNKGLERRFPWRFTIDTYNTDELISIFKKLCSDMKWDVAPDAITEKDLKPELFVNAGGDINNLITSCIMKHFHHVFMKNEQQMILSREDVLAGLALYKENKERGKQAEDSKPPVHMYV
jgi:hypothetical protein